MPDALMTDLLSDFTQNNVEWLRRATARRASLSSEEWPQLAIVCETVTCVAKKYRDLVHAVLCRGVEAGTLKARLERAMTFLNDGIQAMAELQEVGSSASPDNSPDLDRIRNASAESEVVRKDLASLLALARAKPKPVAEDVLAAAEAGPFIRLDEFRKRQ